MSVAVAKKRASKASQKDAMRDELIAVRCTSAYKGWVKRFAKNELVTPTQLVAIALKALAADRSFELPPDR